jgi:outer membrane protein assembly factor BamB
MFRFGPIAATLVLSASALRAADFATQRLENWHHWRGPEATGVAPLGDPPTQWSEQTNVKWKVEVPGHGSASPVVWGNRIFVLTAIESGAGTSPLGQNQGGRRGQDRGGRGGRGGGDAPTTPVRFVVQCFDRGTGRILWQQVANELVPHEGYRAGDNSFASGSPITDGQLLYASFGSFGIYCYDLDGNLQWKRDLGNMTTRLGFGEGASPALHGDKLFVNWDHEEQSFITALDAKSGETRWMVERDEATTWATPLVVEYQGRTQVITNGSNRVRSYDANTGQLIWECGGQVANPIPSPVALDGLTIVMTGYRGNAVYAIPLDAAGDITNTAKIAWHRTDAGPYVASPVLYKGQLYYTKERTSTLFSVRAVDGEPLIQEVRLPGLETIYASPVAAADRIYFTDRGGTTVVLKHGPQLEVVATNKLGEGIDASPAVVGRQIFLRGQNHLYCIENRNAVSQSSAPVVLGD